MKLPNREYADIPQTKLIDYLLSENHAVGRSKATFFRNIGFDELNHLLLKKAIYDIAQKEEIKQVVPSVYGIKYVIDEEL
ncbi:MAG TPA: hypothetical protein PLP19_19020 [bacterium]|nr:hypothetical protein [bacterium]HPN45589.1 hypothetical protein [bacterium]